MLILESSPNSVMLLSETSATLPRIQNSYHNPCACFPCVRASVHAYSGFLHKVQAGEQTSSSCSFTSIVIWRTTLSAPKWPWDTFGRILMPRRTQMLRCIMLLELRKNLLQYCLWHESFSVKPTQSHSSHVDTLSARRSRTNVPYGSK